MEKILKLDLGNNHLGETMVNMAAIETPEGSIKDQRRKSAMSMLFDESGDEEKSQESGEEDESGEGSSESS